MATWGAYFASYVKKNPTEEKAAAADASEVLGVVQPLKPVAKASASNGTDEKDTTVTDGFKRSNSTAKKLYEIPTEFPKEALQRSTSNASRVAKMFGYTNANATLAKDNGTSKLGRVVAGAVSQAADGKTREEEKRSNIIAGLFAKREDATLAVKGGEIIIGLPPNLLSNATIVGAESVATMNMKEIAVEKASGLGKVDLYGFPSNQISKSEEAQGSTPLMFETAATKPAMIRIQKAGSNFLTRLPDTIPTPSALESTEASTTTHKPAFSRLNNDIQAMLDDFASQAKDVSTPTKVPEKIIASPIKPDIQNAIAVEVRKDTKSMLDLFASQVQALESVDDIFSNESVGAKLNIEPKAMPASRRKASKALDMLDFFASQADTAIATTKESPKPRPTAKTSVLLGQNSMEKKLQPPSRRNKSLEMLDFFANQAMSSISEDNPLGTVKKMALTPLPENKALTEAPKLPHATVAQALDEEEAVKVPPPKSPLAKLLEVQEQPRILTMERGPVTPITVKSPSRILAISTGPPETVPIVPRPKAAQPAIIRAAKTMQTSASYPIKRTNPTRGSATSFELRTVMDDDDQEIEESEIDFRERFLEYEKQAEQIRLEKEQMEIEHERMLEEMAMFQKEADRIAEEEAAMKKFVENLEAERLRDAENEDRKQREREARLEAERLERERTEDERLERLMKKEADQAIAEAFGKERRARAVIEEKEKMARAEEARMDAEIEDARRRKMEARMEAERLAQEEVDRLNAEMRRYAEEAEADRLLMEEELEREEAERLEAERMEKEESLNRERLRYQEEQEEYERQRDEDERFARQQRRAARAAAERLEYEQEMAEEEEARYAKEGRRREESQKIERDRRAEVQRRSNEEARYAEQGRLAARLQIRNEIVKDDLESEDEIVKAERKIKEAFAGLAKERGQAPAPGPTPIKRANTAQVMMQRQPDRRPRLQAQDDDTDVRVSRNNTIGARPQPPRKDQPVMRDNTMRGRPLIQGGLPSGPRRRRE